MSCQYEPTNYPITQSQHQARCIGIHRPQGQTTLGSDTVSRDNFFSYKRSMCFQKAQQNRIPKVGSIDSSQRTSLLLSSFGNLRTQFAKVNYNDSRDARRRVRNSGSVAPPKKGANRLQSTSTKHPYGGSSGNATYS